MIAKLQTDIIGLQISKVDKKIPLIDRILRKILGEPDETNKQTT